MAVVATASQELQEEERVKNSGLNDKIFIVNSIIMSIIITK